MPVYEFRCRSCAGTYEELMSASAAVPPCPTCGSDAVDRLVSSFAAASRRRPDFSSLARGTAPCCGGSCGGHGRR